MKPYSFKKHSSFRSSTRQDTLFSLQTIKGWKRLAPGRTRLPLLMVVILLCYRLVLAGHWSKAVAVLLCFTAYLRPSEPFTPRGKQLVPPVPGTRHRHWVVILHPWEGRQASKTQHFDDAITLDSGETQFLAPALKWLKDSAGDEGRVHVHADAVQSDHKGGCQPRRPGTFGDRDVQISALRSPPRFRAGAQAITRDQASRQVVQRCLGKAVPERRARLSAVAPLRGASGAGAHRCRAAPRSPGEAWRCAVAARGGSLDGT